eukprot:8859710-Pyramimonas_sp.AAC.1
MALVALCTDGFRSWVDDLAGDGETPSGEKSPLANPMSVWLLGEAKSHGVPTDVELGLSSAFSGEENNTAGDGSLEMRSLSESSTLHTDVALPEFVASPSSITASNRATLCRRKWFSSSFALCCASNSSLFFCNCAICSRSVRVAVPAAPGTGTPSAGSSVGVACCSNL